MKNDIKINELYQINEVAKVLNIDEKYLECYSKYKAKINLEITAGFKIFRQIPIVNVPFILKKLKQICRLIFQMKEDYLLTKIYRHLKEYR